MPVADYGSSPSAPVVGYSPFDGDEPAARLLEPISPRQERAIRGARVTTAEELISRSFTLGKSGADAQDALEALGPPAVDAILDWVDQNVVPAPTVLQRALGGVAARHPKVLAHLVDVAAGDGEVAATAIGALGHAGDRKATSVLVRALTDPLGDLRWAPAAGALAMLADPQSRGPLRKQVEQWTAAGNAAAIEALVAQAEEQTAFALTWPLSVLEALSAIGDQSASSLGFAIVSIPKATLNALTSGSALIGSMCMSLRTLAGPGFFDAARSALKGASGEVKQILARVLGHVGNRTALSLLVEIAQTKAASTSQAAAYWIDRVGGTDLPEARHYGAAATAWWKKAERGFRDDTVYWDGQPWTADHLLNDLGYGAGESDEAEADLVATAGIHLGVERRKRRLSRDATIAECRKEAASRFAAGCLYRHGHAIDVESLCRRA